MERLQRMLEESQNANERLREQQRQQLNNILVSAARDCVQETLFPLTPPPAEVCYRLSSEFAASSITGPERWERLTLYLECLVYPPYMLLFLRR